MQEYIAIRVLPQPFTEREDGRLCDKRNLRACFGAADPIKCTVLKGVPDRLRQSVVEHEDVLEGVARRPECCGRAVYFASVNYGQLIEWSPAYGDGFAADIVVDQFVPVQQTDGVGSGDAVVLEADHLQIRDACSRRHARICWLTPSSSKPGIVCFNEDRVVNGRDRVATYAVLETRKRQWRPGHVEPFG